MTITEFARSHGVEPQAVSRYLKRHEDTYKIHLTHQGREVLLDAPAVMMLEQGPYPQPKPVQLISGIDPEEHKRAIDERDAQIKHLTNRILEASDAVAMLKDELSNERVGRALIEQKATSEMEARQRAQADAEAVKKELEEARAEIERLKHRGLLERLLNR